MKILLFGILLFTFYSTGSAQYIFRPFKDERALTKAKDIKKEEVDITKMGKPCGEYFLYEDIKDTDGSFEHVVSFKVPVTQEEYFTGTNDFIRIGREAIKIKLDDKIEVPTAKWEINSSFRNIIVRISSKDLRAASCLSTSP